MYIPPKMAMESQQQMQQFIDEYSFGVLISNDLQATHLPFLIECNENGERALLGHFARANPHWKNLDGERVLTIFNGPHAYISPAWYALAPAVPTWNYAAVHVIGTLSIIDNDCIHSILDKSLQKFEPSLLKDRAIVSQEIQQKMRSGVVGFRIDIESMEGKMKLGQIRSVDDQLGVADGLKQSNAVGTDELLTYMHDRQLGVGGTSDSDQN